MMAEPWFKRIKDENEALRAENERLAGELKALRAENEQLRQQVVNQNVRAFRSV